MSRSVSYIKLGEVDITVTKKYYTYRLRYPAGYQLPSGEDLSNVVFYIGKGSGQRPLCHLREAYAGQLGRVHVAIREVWKSGKQIQVEIPFESDIKEEAALYERGDIRKYTIYGHLVNRQFNRGNKQHHRKYTLSETSQEKLSEIANKLDVDYELALAMIIDQKHQEIL